MRYCPPIYVLCVSSHLWTVPRQIKFWSILIKSWDWARRAKQGPFESNKGFGRERTRKNLYGPLLLQNVKIQHILSQTNGFCIVSRRKWQSLGYPPPLFILFCCSVYFHNTSFSSMHMTWVRFNFNHSLNYYSDASEESVNSESSKPAIMYIPLTGAFKVSPLVFRFAASPTSRASVTDSLMNLSPPVAIAIATPS